VRKGSKLPIHKLKAERYGNFTIQKTFGLEELKAIESAEGLVIKLQLGAKTYDWALEHADAKAECLLALVHLSTPRKGSVAASKKVPAPGGRGPAVLNTNLDLLRDSVKFSETPSGIPHVLEYVDEALRQHQHHRPAAKHGDPEEGERDLEGAALGDEQDDLDSYQQNIELDEILRDFEAEVGGDASAIESRLTLELVALEAVGVSWCIGGAHGYPPGRTAWLTSPVACPKHMPQTHAPPRPTSMPSSKVTSWRRWRCPRWTGPCLIWGKSTSGSPPTPTSSTPWARTCTRSSCKTRACRSSPPTSSCCVVRS
jgi:hypothetical protein